MTYTEIASQYIQNVLDGQILSCEYVKQACQRQRDDLSNSDIPFVYDVSSAERICKFVELLTHIKGQWAGAQIKLEPWQIFILTTVFGWVDQQGNRRFKTVYTEVPRKNAKSTLSSAVALYTLGFDQEGGAEVYSAATTRDQARIVFQDAKNMVDRSTGLKSRGFKTSAHAIYQESSVSTFKALSRDQGGNLDGLNVHCAIVDELHAHKTRDVWDVLETGTGARTQPLLWAITTAGFNRAGICYEQRAYTLKILEGSVKDDEYFGVIYTIDKDDDPFDEAIWQKANPNWGVSVNPDDIKRKARKAMEMVAAQNNFLTKHLNVWVNAAESWMNMVKWDDCAKKLDIGDFAGNPCFIGLDLAEKRDIAAISILFNVKGEIYQFGRYYQNEYQVENSGNSQYSGWQRSGHLIVNDGDITDFDLIKAELIALSKQFQVEQVVYDPKFSPYFAMKLQDEGVPMVPRAQTSSFYTAPFIELENLVYESKFYFDGNPVLTWMVSNTMAKTSIFSGLINPVKEREENKIDGVIATLMALGHMQANENENHAYMDRGFLTL